MRKILVALCLLALAGSLPACTAKGSSVTPLVSQRQPMDGSGGGPQSGCGDQGCPDPTPGP